MNKERMTALVDVAMEAALENGYDMDKMSASALAEDLMTYNVDFENADKVMLTEVCAEWKLRRGGIK